MTLADFEIGDRLEHARHDESEPDARQDRSRHPDGQEALESAHQPATDRNGLQEGVLAASLTPCIVPKSLERQPGHNGPRLRSRPWVRRAATLRSPVVTDETIDGPGFPLREMLGFTIDSGTGQSRVTLEVDERHLNPHGSVHGAVMFALVDTAMGGATMSVLDEGSWCATVDIHTRFLAPCFSGTLTASATVRRSGRRVVHLDGVVTDEAGKEYTAASGVFAVIPAAG